MGVGKKIAYEHLWDFQSQLHRIWCAICLKVIKIISSSSPDCCIMGTGRNIKGPPLEQTPVIPLLASIYIYTCVLAKLFFFSSSSGLERACACRKHYLLADTDSRSSRRGWQPLQKHFPFCGAGLGPSHLNLAGLTWNSLPVGLPQQHPPPHPLTPTRQPRQTCVRPGLPVNSSSWCQPLLPLQNWLQPTLRYLQRKKEEFYLYLRILVELVWLAYAQFALFN